MAFRTSYDPVPGASYSRLHPVVLTNEHSGQTFRLTVKDAEGLLKDLWGTLNIARRAEKKVQS